MPVAVAAAVAVPEPQQVVSTPAVDPLAEIAARVSKSFQLSALEQRLLALLLRPDAAYTVAVAAQELALSCEQAIITLASDQRLRAHGLVEVGESAELGFLRPDDRLFAGRGLLLSGLVSEAALFTGQLPGVMHLPAPSPGTSWAQELMLEKPSPQLTELVKEKLVAAQPVLLWLSGCSVEQSQALAQLLRYRLQRPVVQLDGTALQGWPVPQLASALRRLRRDADLKGAVLLVTEAHLLGGAWRALAGPRPAGQSAPLILASSQQLAAPVPLGAPGVGLRGDQAWLTCSVSLRVQPVGAVQAGAGPTSADAAAGMVADPALDDPAAMASRDDARRRAAMDAARAMGKPIPTELMAAVPPPAAAAPVSRPATPGPTPAAAAALSTAPAPAAVPAPAESAAPSAPKPMNPRLAAALAKAGMLPPGTQVATPTPAARPGAKPAEVAAAPPARPVPASPTAVDSAVAAPDSKELVEPPPPDDQPPLPLADDAPHEEALRVLRTTPNQAQRAELLRRFAGSKSPAVIQLFRANTSSPHPGVRAAAEAGMASVFGVNWNRSRPIAPPVQPPRSDDSGRGPGGAF